MSYQVLARKWRPRRFQEMVGQEHILRMLSNALSEKRYHHAYLFTGTRGVGKTTLARILAKCFNCEDTVTATPCMNCATCRAIDAGQFLDLFEVDAASRTKVEDTRELLENVMYPPSQGRYKIYLIDEVHMLSNHSFNALLKTLEEPPEHVKFLLATTDPKRLPITILSRCLQFHLKRITAQQIAAHLAHVCDAEKFEYEKEGLEKIAQAADGSMRDALSLLDQAIAYGRGKILKTEVFAMLGSTHQADLLPLLDALANQESTTLFSLMAHLAEQGPDFEQVLEEIISLFHQIAIAQAAPEARPVAEHLTALAARFSPEDVQLYYQIALLGRRDLKIAPTPLMGFEMTLLRMLAFKPGHSLSSAPTPPPPPKIQPAAAVTPTPTIPVKERAEVQNSSASFSLPEWRTLLPALNLSGMAHALAANCTLEKVEGNKIELALSKAHLPMFSTKLKDRMEEALSAYCKQSIKLEINTSTTELLTPLKQEREEQQNRLEAAKETIKEDPLVKQLMEMYDASIEVSLVT